MDETLEICIGMFSRYTEETNVSDDQLGSDWDNDIEYDGCEWQVSYQNVHFEEIVCDVNGEKIRHIDKGLLDFNVKTDCIDLFDIDNDGWYKKNVKYSEYSCDIDGEPIRTITDEKLVVLIWKRKLNLI